MRKKSSFCALCAAMLLTATVVTLRSVVHAAGSEDDPTPSATVSVTTSIERLDPAVNRIIPAQPILERIATGFKWTEGPLWLPSGNLIFAEIPSNSIRMWNPERGVSIFMQPSGYKGPGPYGGPEPGSNAMTLDAVGRLTVAGHAQRDVWRLEKIDSGAQITILADTYQGKRLNSPMIWCTSLTARSTLPIHPMGFERRRTATQPKNYR